MPTEDVSHRPDVYVTDASRDDSVAPVRRKRIVIQNHGKDLALWYYPQPEWQAAARHAAQHHALLGEDSNTARGELSHAQTISIDTQEVPQVVEQERGPKRPPCDHASETTVVRMP